MLCICAGLLACAIDQRTELSDGTGGSPGTGNIGGGGFGGTSGGPPVTGGSGGTSDAGSVGGAAGVPSGGGAGAGGSAGEQVATVEYVATVADCVSATAPNPDVCAGAYFELHLDVSADFLAGATSLVYLRFDLDNQIAGAKVISAELQLANVNGSINSGEVHEVPTFDRPSLFVAAPTLGQTIAQDLGLVSFGQPVTWYLSTPPTANKDYCLGIATNTTDGIGYATLGSGTPPKLRVTYSK